MAPDDRLKECERIGANLASDLPQQLSLKPFFDGGRLLAARLVTVREVLRYRIAELSHNAIRCFVSQHLVSGTALTRASFETAALLFHIDKRVSAAVESQKLDDIGEFLLKAVVGSKNNPKAPTAVNVLTSISSHLEKQYPGLEEQFFTLCEFTHPNFAGGLGSYGVTDESLTLKLGLVVGAGGAIYPMLHGALKLFEYHYNHIADTFTAFLQLCERLHPGGDPG